MDLVMGLAHRDSQVIDGVWNEYYDDTHLEMGEALEGMIEHLLQEMREERE